MTGNSLLDDIDRQAPKLLEAQRCPGLALALLDGEHTDIRCYGLADVARGEPVTEQTIFQVCSISKAVSAWGLMRLADDGRIDLDAPVESYLSRWKLPESDFDHRQVTVRRLLSHTAGLPVEGYMGIPPGVPLPAIEGVLNGRSPAMDERQLAYARKWGFDPATKHQAIRVLRTPGEAFSYSGGGYVILDLLIEEVTGLRAAEYLDRFVLSPLGLDHSTFETLDPDHSGYAAPYDELGERLPRYRYSHRTAGAMTADIGDLAKFVRAEFDRPGIDVPGAGLLSADSFRAMFEPVVFAERAGGMDFHIGLGHFLGEMAGHRLVQHSGGSAGWRSIYFVLPEAGLGFAALINGSGGNEVWQALAQMWAAAI
ncbi:MAG: serine hydrolase domain-containing protein [Pseudomonadales bacterium]